LLSKEEILKEVQIFEGINILAVNLSKARKRLLANPWIAEARISRVLPSEIHVIINEHKPFAILDLGRKFILNSRGELFKEWEPSDPGGLPVVAGLGYADIPAYPRNRGDVSGVAFEAVMDVLRLGEEEESPVPNRFVERIEVDREMGITLKIGSNPRFEPAKGLEPTRDPFEINNKAARLRIIKLGYNNYIMKYERLKQILVYIKTHYNELSLNKEKEKGLFRIDSIDLNNLNRIVINCDQLSVISDPPFTTDH